MTAAVQRRRVSFDQTPVVINGNSKPKTSLVNEENELAAFLEEEDEEEESDSKSDGGVSLPISNLDESDGVDVSAPNCKVNETEEENDTLKSETLSSTPRTSGDISAEKRRNALKKRIQEYNDRMLKRGVVYLYRIPPFFTPTECRERLSEFASILRIYLEPQDKSIAAKRNRFRSNARFVKINYVRGWVEFADKKEAKRTVKMLDCNGMGVSKRDKYYHNQWHMKYLKGFKWRHLTEKFKILQAEQNQKLQQEERQMRREEKFYKRQFQKSRSFEKKARKRLREEDEQTSQKKMAKKYRQMKNIEYNVDLEAAKALLSRKK